MVKQATRSQTVQKRSGKALILPPNPEPSLGAPASDPLVSLTVKIRMSEYTDLKEFLVRRGYGFSDGIRAMIQRYMEQK